MTHLGSGSSRAKRKEKKTDIFPLLRQLNLDSAKLHCFGFIYLFIFFWTHSFYLFLYKLFLFTPGKSLDVYLSTSEYIV